MPGGICGTWPAWWTLGDGNWPGHGEIDILEGVNLQATDLVSAHTTPGCSISGSGQSGTLKTGNCDINAAGQGTNTGCGVVDPNPESYSGFNAGKGGTYAMEWTSDYIRVYYFPRGSAPGDINGPSPNPASWGTPAANLQGDCNIDQHFQNHQMVNKPCAHLIGPTANSLDL